MRKTKEELNMRLMNEVKYCKLPIGVSDSDVYVFCSDTEKPFSILVASEHVEIVKTTHFYNGKMITIPISEPFYILMEDDGRFFEISYHHAKLVEHGSADVDSPEYDLEYLSFELDKALGSFKRVLSYIVDKRLVRVN